MFSRIVFDKYNKVLFSADIFRLERERERVYIKEYKLISLSNQCANVDNEADITCPL